MRRAAFLLLLAATVATVGAAGILGWSRVLEAWHLGRFQSSDAAVRRAAAGKLIERRSVQAVPLFLNHYLEKDRDPGENFISPLLAALERPEMELVARRARSEDPARLIHLAELHKAAASPRTSFVPILRVALASADPALRRWAAEELALLGPEAREAAGDLRDVLDDPSELVRLWAEIALMVVNPGTEEDDPNSQ